MPSMRIDLDPEAVKIIPPGMTFIQAVRAGYAGRIESRAYLDWIKTMPCDTCGAPGPSDPSHVNAFKGQGTKSPDLFAIPECRPCHISYERGPGFAEDRIYRAAFYMLRAFVEGRLKL